MSSKFGSGRYKCASRCIPVIGNGDSHESEIEGRVVVERPGSHTNGSLDVFREGVLKFCDFVMARKGRDSVVRGAVFEVAWHLLPQRVLEKALVKFTAGNTGVKLAVSCEESD